MLTLLEKYASKVLVFIVALIITIFANAIASGQDDKLTRLSENDASFLQMLLACSTEEQEALLKSNAAWLNHKIWNGLSSRAWLALYKQGISESRRIHLTALKVAELLDNG